METPLDFTALAKASASGSEASRAFAELAALLGEIEADWVGPQRGAESPEEQAARRKLVAHALQHGFQVWFGADPRRPVFHRFVGFPEVMPAWVSNEVNRFDNSAYDESNTEIGYAAVDNAYLQTRYALGPDQALVLRGRFPRCRFANVVLWSHRLQTPPYRYRRVSLNRSQIHYERDGRFTLVVAHRDPGVPNWLDTAGRASGMIFWRFLLPEENVPPIMAEVVDVGALGRA